jgi:hypothetical protein
MKFSIKSVSSFGQWCCLILRYCWLFVWMIYLLVKVGCWGPPLLLYLDLSLPLCSGMFILWNWLNWHLVHICLESLYLLGAVLSLVTLFISSNFGLKSAFSAMSIATPACFQLPLAWYITFHLFTFSLYVFACEVCFLKKTNSWYCFFDPVSQSVFWLES